MKTYTKIDDRTLEESEEFTEVKTSVKRWCLNEINAEIASLTSQKDAIEAKLAHMNVLLVQTASFKLIQ